ncbi:hypothetical protein [Myxacorys almedinensis]|uniref:Uncharacterized protein n=1 Tax=Myxacorys almedinensis A TaxID=2690445 RepID=A0A8J7YYR7_9CYAN|nr:hypothetical protein [Myxacorys almedinensis]NDJ17062.1 hypothetical protein [Myxacorys almedinensis A]
MQEIEVMGAIDEQGQLLLLQPLSFSKHARVRVRITLLDENFEPEADSKTQILADLKESFRQAEAGQTFPISELWDGIDV